jgi:hypothetical protein
MTAAPEYFAEVRAGETMELTLRAAHEIWLREADRFLSPVATEEAPFWTRWTTVRYLADQFLAQYRRECALVVELHSFLPPDVVDRLTLDGERIARLVAELDRVGRRRCSGHTVSVVSQTLLHLLRAWCADIEAAAAGGRRLRRAPGEGGAAVSGTGAGGQSAGARWTSNG